MNNRPYHLNPNKKFVPPEPRSGEAPACIRDIFLHSEEKHKHELIEKFNKAKVKNDNKYSECLGVYPNMTEITPKNKPKGASSNRGGGTKQKITGFTRKSRRNFIKHLCKLGEPIELWQDFTFADDVMGEKTIKQRRDISNDTLNRFRRTLKNKYPALWAIYKREWEPRKSGSLIGEYIPHFHMFIAVRNEPKSFNYLSLAFDLALLWVQCTKTGEFGKALRVAQHPRSYRLIDNQQHAMGYASKKYLVKANEFNPDESIGRSWGTIGDVKIEKPRIIELTPDEAIRFKRVARKTVHKAKKGLKKSLSRPEIPTFLIIKEETTDRIMKYVDSVLEWECRSFSAEVS